LEDEESKEEEKEHSQREEPESVERVEGPPFIQFIVSFAETIGLPNS
jgi:hypothetical protein